MDIALTPVQLSRAAVLLESHLQDHDRRGLEILVGLHHQKKPADLGRQLGMSGFAVTKRCRAILASGVDEFLDKLCLETRIFQRASQFHPDDSVASLAEEFGVPERKVRHLLEQSGLTLPSTRGIQTIADLFDWVDAKSEPIFDLAGVSISKRGRVAVLAIRESAKNHVHYRGFLHDDLSPRAYWTKLSKQDQRFAEVFKYLRESSLACGDLSADDGAVQNQRFIEQVQTRFPPTYRLVIIVSSQGDVAKWEKVIGSEREITVHSCGEPLFGWMERLFYTLRLHKSSAGLCPNLGGLYDAVFQSFEPTDFEWIGSASDGETVINRRLVADLFHSLQGHIHELTPWLWIRGKRENSTHLVTFRWNTKTSILQNDADRDAERLMSISALPGISFPLWLSTQETESLNQNLRDTSIAKRVYLSNGLDNGGVRPRHVFHSASELRNWQSDAIDRKEKRTKEMPGSGTVLLTRHLFFPEPPVNLDDLAAMAGHFKSPVARKMVPTAKGMEDTLVFSAPDLLRGIRDAFNAEVYADFIVEATSWEEQSVANLGISEGADSDGSFLGAMEQINPRMPILRPGTSLKESEERWRDLFYNCDPDFLILGIADEEKQALERHLDEWTERVTSVIVEAYKVPEREPIDLSNAPEISNKTVFQNCFQEAVQSYAKSQRRIARRALETCTRLVMAGLPPVALAFVPLGEIMREFRRELSSRIRGVHSSGRKEQIVPLFENEASPSPEGIHEEIAELLVESRRMLAVRSLEATFWREIDDLTSVAASDWESALDLLETEEPEAAVLSRLQRDFDKTGFLPSRRVSEGKIAPTLFERSLLAYRLAVRFEKVGEQLNHPDSEPYKALEKMNPRKQLRVRKEVGTYAPAKRLLRKILAAVLLSHKVAFLR